MRNIPDGSPHPKRIEALKEDEREPDVSDSTLSRLTTCVSSLQIYKTSDKHF